MPKDENFEKIVGENYGHAEAHLGHEAYQAQVELTRSQVRINEAQLASSEKASTAIFMKMHAKAQRDLAVGRLYHGIAFLFYMVAILTVVWSVHFLLGGG